MIENETSSSSVSRALVCGDADAILVGRDGGVKEVGGSIAKDEVDIPLNISLECEQVPGDVQGVLVSIDLAAIQRSELAALYCKTERRNVLGGTCSVAEVDVVRIEVVASRVHCCSVGITAISALSVDSVIELDRDLVLGVVVGGIAVPHEDGCAGLVDDELFIVYTRIDKDGGVGLAGNWSSVQSVLNGLVGGDTGNRALRNDESAAWWSGAINSRIAAYGDVCGNSRNGNRRGWGND